MRAGGLRTQITVIAPPTARNAFNEVRADDYTQWVAVQTLWGQVQPLRGVLLDIAQAGGASADASHQVIIRYNPNISINNRLQIGGTMNPSVCLTGASVDDIAGDAVNDIANLTIDPSTAPATRARYFTIQAIADENFRHRMMTLYCAEVVRGN